jgi:hypothetical protein
MTIDDLQLVLEPWKALVGSLTDVSFRERRDPPIGVGDDYRVAYELAIEPTVLDKARVELWLTDSGHVAVGVESYERVAQRLNVKMFRQGFAAGHEPRVVPPAGLGRLLALVAEGRIVIIARVMLGLTYSLKMGIPKADYDDIEQMGYGCDWLLPLRSDLQGTIPFAQVANYRPWRG